jgi:hypothetical protein
MISSRRGTFVQKDRNFQLASNSFPESCGKPDTIFHRRPLDWNEWDDVCGAHPRMHAGMASQINEVGCGTDRTESRIDD